MLTQKQPIPRGRRPLPIRITAPQASAEILGQQEQTLGIKLHPLAWRLPPPTEKELSQLEVELKDDWVGLVAYAEFDGRPCLLTGLPRLMAWSRLGRNRKEVPTCGIRYPAGDEALRFLLQEAVGRQERWTESRRAVVASLYADEVRAALSPLQSALGLKKGRNGTTDMVLGRLSQTSGPLVTLARRTARVDNAAFSDIFQGRRRALPQFAARDGVSRPMSHSGHAPYSKAGHGGVGHGVRMHGGDQRHSHHIVRRRIVGQAASERG